MLIDGLMNRGIVGSLLFVSSSLPFHHHTHIFSFFHFGIALQFDCRQWVVYGGLGVRSITTHPTLLIDGLMECCRVQWVGRSQRISGY
jgi:hypothetical protein